MKNTKDMLKKLVVMTLCFIISNFDWAFGLGRVLGDLDDDDRAEIAVYNNLNRLDQKRKIHERRIKEIEDKIGAKNLSEPESNRLKKQLAAENRALDSLYTPGNALGRIVANGISGKNLSDSDIDGLSDGIWKGITARTAQAFGDVVSEKARGTMEHVLGGAWNTTVDSLVNGFETLEIRLFHNSKRPYTEPLISGWFELVLGSLKDIELILKDYLKESSRGHDKSLRQFDGDLNHVEEANSGWRDLVAGDIDVFDYIIHDIEDRKEHYDANDPIVYFANQIQKRLLKFRNLLAKAKTIKELDASFDSNRSIVEALKNDLARLFKHLTDLITPRSYSSTNRNTTSSQAARAQAQKSKYSGNQRHSEREEDFPGTMFGG